MSPRYDATLVVVSVLIAIFASYTALALVPRVAASTGRFRAAWLVGGSVAVGLGIWSMHFVGMLAFDLHVPAAYGVPRVAVSAIIPIFGAALALHVTAAERVRAAARLGATLAIGAILVAMHVTGFTSMRVPATVSFDTPLLLAGCGLAVAAAYAWITLGTALRADEPERGRRALALGAVLIGVLLAGMHYAAMSAARFVPLGHTLHVTDETVLQTDGLAWGVSAATLLLLVTAMAATLVERRMRRRSAETEALRRSEDRFRSLVVATAQIIWTTDANGEFAAEQPEWAAFTGTTFDHYRGWGWLRSVHPGDRDRAAAEWRAALESRTLLETEHRVCRADGEWRDMQVRAVPVLEPSGRIREWVGAETDVTERKKEQRGTAFLAEAGRVLASSLDYQRTLRTVAKLAVPELADWCAVDLVVEGSRTERVAVEHPDPEKIRFVQALEERYPADPAATTGLPQVIRTGKPEMLADIPDALIEAAAVDAEHLRLIRELGLRSYIVVPLIAREKTLGAITLVHAESGRRYDAHDLALAEELARRAAVAIDNARLFEETEEARAQLEQQAAELQEAQAEMEMAHDELQQANDELVVRTAEAERARAAADEANAAKSAFLATMSHELRTPLNAIAGYAQLLEMGIHGEVNDTQREYLDKIRRNQTHLLGLINDVLNFAKIEAGQVVYDIADVPADETLRAIEALIEPQVKARQHQYVYRAGDPRVSLRADRDRVEQIVLNLLSNAVKFTGNGGRIVLEWEAGDGQVCIRVRDTGRGIPAEKLPAVFEPFVQVDPTLTRSNEGTGLGLAISRDLARAMHGDLTVESEVGAGSTFTLTLPRGRDLPAPSPAPDGTRDAQPEPATNAA